MTPEELDTIENRLNRGIVKSSDMQVLIDECRSLLGVGTPIGKGGKVEDEEKSPNEDLKEAELSGNDEGAIGEEAHDTEKHSETKKKKSPISR